jgi:hypothetical protein
MATFSLRFSHRRDEATVYGTSPSAESQVFSTLVSYDWHPFQRVQQPDQQAVCTRSNSAASQISGIRTLP